MVEGDYDVVVVKCCGVIVRAISLIEKTKYYEKFLLHKISHLCLSTFTHFCIFNRPRSHVPNARF